jgi:hypothetical protein
MPLWHFGSDCVVPDFLGTAISDARGLAWSRECEAEGAPASHNSPPCSDDVTTTNAAKHGALSAPHGRITLSRAKHDERVDFDWVESGGPQPIAPQREGFGSTLLRKGLRQFDGAVEIRFAPSGLRCKLSLSLPRSR